ncbi:nucleolar protein 16-like [Penaeus indicus]|uniref:nucleolar protein 16-like n=1 Tax=Penaeus indicus TaxID=29960 RepID=UPI00300CFD76
MGVRQRKKMRKQFRYETNRKREFNKGKKTKIDIEVIRKVWDKSKSTHTNMAQLGLEYKLNKIMPPNEMETDVQKKDIVDKGKQKAVVETLESQVKNQVAKTKLPPRLTHSQRSYIRHMMQRHGTNYYAMSKDPKNYYQDTPKQLEAKIKSYMDNPRYYIPDMRKKGLLPAKLAEKKKKVQDKKKKAQKKKFNSKKKKS